MRRLETALKPSHIQQNSLYPVIGYGIAGCSMPHLGKNAEKEPYGIRNLIGEKSFANRPT